MLFDSFRNNQKTIKLLKLFKSRLSATKLALFQQMGSPKSHRTPEELARIREKPFIVICGCTGTGKTKLSIQLAEWLIKNNRQAEIINADAMQVTARENLYYLQLFLTQLFWRDL